MKKLIVGVLLTVLIGVASAAWIPWRVVDWSAAGTTEVIAARAGMIPVMENYLGSIQNASYIYFHDGASTNLTGALYFGANGFLSSEVIKMDIVGTSGNPINVWCSADPGGSLNIIDEDYVTN